MVGWKGPLYDRELEGSSDSVGELCVARRIFASIAKLSLRCTTEFLNPMLPPFQKVYSLNDCIGVGAVERRIDREVASGLDMPIGMKNNLVGDALS